MYIAIDSFPSQIKRPPELSFSPEECATADNQISTLLSKCAIMKVDHDDGSGFYSNVFLAAKCTGGFRMILNLSRFNHFVSFSHFKMDTLQHILAVVTPGCFMSTFDLTDAYLTVPVAPEHWKILKFSWRGIIYMYMVLPFGISSAPRKFTKVLKPILSYLCSAAVTIPTYLDDGWITAPDYQSCF